MKKPVVEFKDFTFQYFAQAEPTLHNINLTIYEGEKVLIVGPSGSGKSTLGHCINGLIPFSYKGKMEGTVTVSGMDTQKASLFALSKKVGTVLQDSDGQFVGLTVGEDIAFSLENDCVPQEEMKKTVREVADIVDMGTLLKSSPYELSGGQKQRVAISRAVLRHPEIIIFDDSTSALDLSTEAKLRKALNEEFADTTVIMIAQRIASVMHADRIAVIENGRITAFDNHENLMKTSEAYRDIYSSQMKNNGGDING